MNSLESFFYPKSICVVGASTKEKSISHEILNCIKRYGYTGKVFPVNPKAGAILGYKCFQTIDDIDEKIDLAIIVVPKQFVEESVESLLKKNVISILIITAGFKETGKEGEELENRILQKVEDAGARLVGPNCMGVINTLDNIRLNATFVAEKPENGTTGFLSQSGALGAAVLNSLRETDIRFTHFISVGNKADVNENDLLHFWQDDDNIKTLTFYLESFENGEEFIIPFIKGEVTKPTIVLKAGKTESGMKAASSHTGALSSKDEVVDALLRQFGIIRADNLNELFNTAKGFENFPTPKGNRIAVITNAGGPAILAVDSIEKEGLVLAQFSETTKNKLREIVHPEGSVENPVDMLPGATAQVYKSANELIINDENVDAVISIFVQPVMVEPFDVMETVYNIKTGKPILQVCMPLPEFWQYYRKHSSKHIPIFRNPEEPSEILANMLFYSQKQNELITNRLKYVSSYESISIKKNNFKTGYLSQKEIQTLCCEYKIPLTKSLTVSANEINDSEFDFFPVVLKGINSKVTHKSELGAVKINIQNKEELLRCAEEIQKNFSKSNYGVEEFLVQQFILTKHELLIGGFRDLSFGPVIMFGSGGKYVEALEDTAIKSCYLCNEDIDDIINSTKIGKILRGIRGETGCDIKELKRIIKSSAEMLIENKNISEFDINPLIIDINNAFNAVDVRIKAS